ncbi:MAG: ABC transporter permease [Ilumatobacter sp.]|uniref:ABC transporter permease n=1 Tax=Ilumatobacter sp. TaxID=1967498 RepID=UPI0032979D83
MTDNPQPPDDLAMGTSLDDALNAEMTETAGLSQAQIVRKRFLRHKGAMFSLFVLVLIVLLATTSVGWGPIPGWWKYSYDDLVPRTGDDGGPTMSLRPTWLGGSGFGLGEHPLGVDNELGKDMFALNMRGVQTSLTIIVVLGLLSTSIGVVVGALSGYYGKWVDSVLMRFTDVVIVLPLLVITAVAGYALGLSGKWSVAVALGIFTWTGLARLVRAEFLALREREFVDAARVANASNLRIIFKHILPNTVGTIVVSTTLLMGAGLLTEAALGFLGFGVRSPEVSLGTLVNQYQGAYETRPWLFIWPGAFIVAIVLCLQFIGDGLRDAFDPRQKRIPNRKDLDRSGPDPVDEAMATTAAANVARQPGDGA